MNKHSFPLIPLLFGLTMTVNAGPPANSGPAVEPDRGVRTRGAFAQQVRVNQPTFQVRVSVDRPDHTYYFGDTMTVTVHSERAGYLYLFYRMADDRIGSLFPNKFQQENYIPANKKVVVPDLTNLPREQQFEIAIGPPRGFEVLKAVVSVKPLREPQIEQMKKGFLQQLKPDGVKGAVVQAARENPLDIAEHDIVIQVLPKPTQSGTAPRGAQRKPKRIGIFIGISDYRNSSYPNLRTCDTDAEELAECLKLHGKFDACHVLTNKAATLQAIRDLIQNVADTTWRGDTIILYWSGHGGRCSDVGDFKEEPDGLDEYLVPYDGDDSSQTRKRQTMLLDDEFGRLMQDLDGRRILVILDCCYGGGQHTFGKSVGDDDPVTSKGAEAFDFLDGDFVRAKDIGQKELSLLASSQATERSYLRRFGKLSTMTYYLIRYLEDEENKGRAVSLDDAYKYLKVVVPEYVKKHYDQPQTPVLINEFQQPLLLKYEER